jgi:hypothetical protein
MINVPYDRVLIAVLLFETLEAFDRRQYSVTLSMACEMLFKIILDALRVLHSGWACCKTRSGNFGDKKSGVNTETCTPSNCSASRSKPLHRWAASESGRLQRAHNSKLLTVLANRSATANGDKGNPPSTPLNPHPQLTVGFGPAA